MSYEYNNIFAVLDNKISKQDLYTILQYINEALYITSLNKNKKEIGQFIEVNQAALEQLGYSKEEFLNLSPIDIIDSTAYPILEDELKQLLEGKILTLESTHITKKGKRIPVEVSSRVIILSDNNKYVLSTVRNISDRKETEMLLEKTAQEFQSLFSNSPDIIFFLNPEGKFTNINPAGEKLLSISKNELLSISYEPLIAPEDLEETTRQFHEVLKGNTALLEISILSKNSEKININITAVPMILQNEIIGITGIARNVTLQKQTEKLLRESEQRYKSLFQHNIDAVITYDLEGNFQSINTATEKLMGYRADELIGKPFLPFIVPEEREKTFEHFNKVIQGTPHHYETCMFNRSGERVYLHITVIPIYINQKLTGIHCIGKDITERNKITEQINYMAYHDPLTGLANQRLFQLNFNKALEQAQKNMGTVTLYFIDLDRFKFINDYLGHDMGDLLLKKISKRLTKCVENKDRIYRYGGDEFIVLLENKNKQQALSLAQSIVQAVSKPYNLEGFEVVVTASLGISIYPTHGDDSKTLMKKADNAMYHAKRQGKNNYQLYNNRNPISSNSNLKAETLLHKAMEREELFLQYQPQIDAKTNTIYGVEALIRWNSKELGIVPPGEFISLAEETGLIVPIGEWVIKTACKQNKKWQEMGLPPMIISVNLSIRHFYQTDLIKKISYILKETKLDPQYLELEITESMAMNANTAEGILIGLRNLGVKIAIDDFGTGYSSLNYLRRFPIDHLKIDQSFVKDIHSDTDDQNIIETIIALGHSLNLSVIAEGVETKEQVDFLQKCQCDILQGYYYSKPVDSIKIPELIQAFRK
ncbi:sensor domain-containing protein [Niallia sp. Sow4_A1]|uniref:sensor domain-containing protein n=1 Tax=Niallia sp. Sow4_A1 TaxID=3438793 RepID=UPI003F9CEAF1